MKKFYAIAAAALAAVSMNGQVYLCGNWDNTLGWDPANPQELTKNEAGDWAITLHLQSFKISTVKAEAGKLDEDGNEIGTWDQFNGGALSTNGGEITSAMVGKTLELEAWGENTNLPWEGDWTITVAADYSTMVLTTTTPEPIGFTACYLRGGMNSWTEEVADLDAKWRFETTDGVVYTFVCEGETAIEPGIEFKVAAANWSGINYSTEDVVFLDGEPMEASYNVNGNMTVDETFEGTIKLDLVNGLNKTAELTFTKASDGIADVTIDANAPVEYFNLQGVRVNNPENGLFIARQGSKITKVIK